MVDQLSTGMTFDQVKMIALALPDVREGVTHGSPSLYIGKRFFACMRDDNETLVMKTAIVERDLLVQLEPDKYFITDHYVPYDYVLVRLSKMDAAELRDLIHKAWRMLALKRLVAKHPEI